jgi:hypothetical protein
MLKVRYMIIIVIMSICGIIILCIITNNNYSKLTLPPQSQIIQYNDTTKPTLSMMDNLLHNRVTAKHIIIWFNCALADEFVYRHFESYANKNHFIEIISDNKTMQYLRIYRKDNIELSIMNTDKYYNSSYARSLYNGRDLSKWSKAKYCLKIYPIH